MSHRNPSVLGEWGPNGKRVVAAESAWKEPLKWHRKAQAEGVRRKVFCASLADVLEDRPELVAPRARLFDLIHDTPYLDWLLLTKRPENAADMIADAIAGHGLQWPWRNVWLGTSVENHARADERIPLLLQIPAAVRFLSIEPLLGPVDLSPWLFCDRCRGPHACGPGAYETPLDNAAGGCWFRECHCSPIGWVIIGGESGPHARPCHVDWIRALVLQCKDANVPVFVKQLGSKPLGRTPTVSGFVDDPIIHDPDCMLTIRDPKGGDPSEWREDLRVRQFPEVPRG